jgi:hypothetical protein
MSRRTRRVDSSGDGAGSLAQFGFRGPCRPSRSTAVVGVEQLMFATPCRIGAGVAMDHCGMGCKLSWARWMPANGRAAQ